MALSKRDLPGIADRKTHPLAQKYHKFPDAPGSKGKESPRHLTKHLGHHFPKKLRNL